MKTKCSDYGTQKDSCMVNAIGENCIFDGTCRAALCTDATLTTSFDTHDECNKYVSKCTPLNYIKTC